MATIKSESNRFSVKGKSNIKDEYVLYIEDLHVSFKQPALKRRLKKEIKNKKNNIKVLNEKVYEKRTTEIKLEILEIKKEIKEIDNSHSDKRKKVLRGVTLGLRQGETLALVGANGAGKTVLVETAFGLLEKDKGQIYLNLGEKTFEKNLMNVGIQFQQSTFRKGLRVSELIDQYRNVYGNEAVDANELLNMITVFDIEPFMGSKVDKLSGGQRQRLNLLLAIMHQPKIMILDEFITGLDVKSVRKIINYVHGLKVKNKASMIIVSHQPEEIQELSDRIIVFNNGKVVEETDTQTVLRSHKNMSDFVEGVI